MRKSCKCPSFPSRNSVGAQFPDRNTALEQRGGPLDTDTSTKNSALVRCSGQERSWLITRMLTERSLPGVVWYRNAASSNETGTPGRSRLLCRILPRSHVRPSRLLNFDFASLAPLFTQTLARKALPQHVHNRVS